MDLYTVDRSFNKVNPIDTFVSCIWTERYYDKGDISLVVPATPDMVSKLAYGTFLKLTDSKEVMIVDTQSIEADELTVTGNSLVAFLDQRAFWVGDNQYTTQYTATTMRPSDMIVHIATVSLLSALPMIGDANDIISGLTINTTDGTTTTVTANITAGQLFTVIQAIAQQYQVGISLVPNGSDLILNVYTGTDRTSDQTVSAPVIFSPASGSLVDISEVYFKCYIQKCSLLLCRSTRYSEYWWNR